MTLRSPIPVLRVFDEALAREYYAGWLGFQVDWEHRFGPGFPVYLQISRGGAILHLSGHWGDGSPGAKVMIGTDDVDALLAELNGRPTPHCHPAIEDEPWGRTMTLPDPFGNRLVFHQAPASEGA